MFSLNKQQTNLVIVKVTAVMQAKHKPQPNKQVIPISKVSSSESLKLKIAKSQNQRHPKLNWSALK